MRPLRSSILPCAASPPPRPSRRCRARGRRRRPRPRRLLPPRARRRGARTTSAWPCWSSSGSRRRAETFRRRSRPTRRCTRRACNLAIAYLYVPDIPAARQAAEESAEGQAEDPTRNYILALIARTEGRAEEAVPYVQKVLAKDPKDLGANVTLGQVYLQMRQYEDAARRSGVAARGRAVQRERRVQPRRRPHAVGPARGGPGGHARFQKLRDSAYKSALGSTYLEQGRYAEAIASTGAEAEAVDPKTPPVTLAEKGRQLPPPRPRRPQAARRARRPRRRRARWRGPAGGGALRILQGRAGRLDDVTAKAGRRRRGRAIAAVAGRLRQRRAARPAGPRRRRASRSSTTRASGRFKDVSATARLPAWPHPPPGRARGHRPRRRPRRVRGGLGAAGRPGAPAPEQRRRHLHATSPSEREARRAGRAVAIVPTDFDNRRDVDLFVLRDATAPRALQEPARRHASATWRGGGLAATGPFRCAAAGDVNKDGFTDFFLGASRDVVAGR